MANYLQLKKQFNSNKKFIKQVLNDQKCQLRLQAEGLSTLNNLKNSYLHVRDIHFRIYRNFSPFPNSDSAKSCAFLPRVR